MITSDGSASQDSTLIIEKLEALVPEPTVHSGDSALASVSDLIEEYADEWGKKAMFQHRWAFEADQQVASLAVATSQMAGAPQDSIATMAAKI